jgi:hypothetical protein
MNTVSQVQLPGFKIVQTIFNRLVKALNRRTPIQGDGISISEGEGGYVISAIKSPDQSQQNQSTGSGGGLPVPPPGTSQWVPVTLQLQLTNCSWVTITVLAAQ